jgi:hypothetical protein
MTKRRAEVERHQLEELREIRADIGLVNVGTCALVLDDGRRVEPGQPLPADTPEDRIAFWTAIGALDRGFVAVVHPGEVIVPEQE